LIALSFMDIRSVRASNLQPMLHRRSPATLFLALPLLAGMAAVYPGLARAQSPTQTPSSAPASVPAGALTEPTPPPEPAPPPPPKPVSARQLREADDAYIEGARQFQKKDVAAAEKDFARAAQLNPANRDYALALIVARESHISELVEKAARARQLGDPGRANALLDQARTIDPDNTMVAQHFPKPVSTSDANPNASLIAEASKATIDLGKFPVADIASTLDGAIQLAPTPGLRSFHLNDGPERIMRAIYDAFGIAVSDDSSVTGGPAIQFDLDNVSFADAVRIGTEVTHLFAVPVQPKLAMIAKDTPEERDRLVPLVEETIYLPGITGDRMTELANLARNVFEVRQVTASGTNGTMLLRGEESLLRQVNASFADLLDDGADVLFDVSLYEVDKTHMVNIGATLPSSAGVFSITGEAQQIITANQSTINQAVASGLLVLNGTALQNLIKELEFLVAAGAVTATQYTNLLGVFGGGLTYAGLYLGSNSSFSLALTATEARMLDSLQIRGESGQDATFRVGSRYPIITSTYSSGISSSLASSLSGLNINGTSVSSLLSKYLGTGSVSTPQFQFEDLGITLKLSPRVLHGNEVQVKLNMKIESLAGGSINSIPILNNRTLTSTITIPAGNTAMLASLVNTNEVGSLTGLPGISELPGFQGTDKDSEKDSSELLITITPHIVRAKPFRIASRRLASVKTYPPAQ
jgi:general secretion pathway protein D